jgi:asparagine synthase (glutamine-hydrolysing)
MLAALRHRGPDGSASRRFPDATLLHTRLRIIDLSPTGDQPMPNERGTIWTVFNGEIYNHRELRDDLRSRGHVFRGTSDTEVLPHLYEEYGTSFVERLRGMFSLAIFDEPARRLVLARDRFGIKPLFFAATGSFIAFASELNTLRLVPGVALEPDPQAIADSAAVLFVPGPATVYRGIRSLEPGTILEARIHRGRIESKIARYASWTVEPDLGLGRAEAVDRAAELIDRAVARQLESDVPLGALLSGGIDSSLVSAAAQSALSTQLLTFNVRMADRAFDETWAAQEVAEAIGSQHETLDISEGLGGWGSVEGLLRHVGQPFADSSLFAVREVSRAMRHRVTVALSGDGGDEAFGGYDKYWQLRPLDLLRSAPVPAARLAAAVARPAASAGLVRKTLPLRIRELERADDVAILQSLFSWLRPAEQRALLVDPTSTAPARRLFEPRWTYPPFASRLERLAARAVEVNLRLVLPDDYLFKVDAGSMRESLEVRVPFLDEDIVSFGLRLPLALRAHRRTSKVVLREVARRRLPAPVAAKPKQGFVVPVDRSVDAHFKQQLRERLLDGGTPVATYFRREIYAPWVEAFVAGSPVAGISRAGLYQRVIMLLSLHVSLAR